MPEIVEEKICLCIHIESDHHPDNSQCMRCPCLEFIERMEEDEHDESITDEEQHFRTFGDTQS